MKNSINTITSFNQQVSVETIYAALYIQYGNYLRRHPSSAVQITTARLRRYAAFCFRGFKLNLNAANSPRDHVRLHKATFQLLASSGQEFLKAIY